MSIRITLTDFEVKQIIDGLTSLRNETALSYSVIKVGQNFYDELIKRLKDDKDESTSNK